MVLAITVPLKRLRIASTRCRRQLRMNACSHIGRAVQCATTDAEDADIYRKRQVLGQSPQFFRMRLESNNLRL